MRELTPNEMNTPDEFGITPAMKQAGGERLLELIKRVDPEFARRQDYSLLEMVCETYRAMRAVVQ
jgi:hypothetical protein